MTNTYIPPKVWVPDNNTSGKWGSINRPVSGARYEQALPVGEHDLQLYSLATPNGQKITIMLEELLALGKDAEYDAYLIDISKGEQFSSGFVKINPNSKIPALVDRSDSQELAVFESASILLHLAEKFDAFLPKEREARTHTFNWLFWLQGSAPYLGGGFGHFYVYAPEKLAYPINRFSMEVKRELDVLDKQLARHQYIAGDKITIADFATWPWYGSLVLGNLYHADKFLQTKTYTNVERWAKELADRPGFVRGRTVNRTQGEIWEKVPERHNAADITNVLKLKP